MKTQIAQPSNFPHDFLLTFNFPFKSFENSNLYVRMISISPPSTFDEGNERLFSINYKVHIKYINLIIMIQNKIEEFSMAVLEMVK